VLTIFVTLSLALPLGVAAALYLEEFAAKNWITDVIEININNLAAVPSIIFGLLGLAVFLNVFGVPRSTPLVGGLVLSLLVLPTIIIASRAAIKSVPPSIKEAALGVGASHVQAVFHHVLPLAVPGILTGTILGVARALGETAPLLMIGMIAFIVDVPHGFSDAATVLPVQVFLWSDLPEAAFQSRTAAAIILLLIVLFAFNALAIYVSNAGGENERYENQDSLYTRTAACAFGQAAEDRGAGCERLLWRQARHQEPLDHHSGQGSVCLHRTIGLRQVHLPALHQSHERYHPGLPCRRQDHRERTGHPRPRP
jgi:phosphate ABC transporter permease subunit PstA